MNLFSIICILRFVSIRCQFTLRGNSFNYSTRRYYHIFFHFSNSKASNPIRNRRKIELRLQLRNTKFHIPPLSNLSDLFPLPIIRRGSNRAFDENLLHLRDIIEKGGGRSIVANLIYYRVLSRAYPTENDPSRTRWNIRLGR